MGLDIRYPIGGLFVALGLILAIYGMLSDPAIYQRSLGVNINLWWGLLMTAGGLVSLYLARRDRKPS